VELLETKEVKRVRGKRNLVWIPIIAMLVVAIAGVGTVHALPTVYVTPQLSSAPVGSTFDICVKADPIEALFVADIRMNYNPLVLEIVDDPETGIVEGVLPCPDPNSLETIYVAYYGATAPSVGFVIIAAGRPTGTKTGLSGDVGIAQVSFKVRAQGDSDLHFYTADLRAVGASLIFVDALADDGGFIGTETPAPTLWLKGHGAGISMDWKSAKWTPGLTNTFSAKVVNTGDADAQVMVEFRVEGPIDDTMTSDIATVPAGGSATVSGVFSVDIAGKYTVVGTISFEFEGEWYSMEIDTQGLGGNGASKDVGNAFKSK